MVAKTCRGFAASAAAERIIADVGRLPTSLHPCTAPGFLDTRLRYAAGRSSYAARASIGV